MLEVAVRLIEVVRPQHIDGESRLPVVHHLRLAERGHVILLREEPGLHRVGATETKGLGRVAVFGKGRPSPLVEGLRRRALAGLEAHLVLRVLRRRSAGVGGLTGHHVALTKALDAGRRFERALHVEARGHSVALYAALELGRKAGAQVRADVGEVHLTALELVLRLALDVKLIAAHEELRVREVHLLSVPLGHFFVAALLVA